MAKSPILFSTSDLMDFVGVMDPLVPGFGAEAMPARGFSAALEAYPLPGMLIFNVDVQCLRARVPEDAREYSVTLANSGHARVERPGGHTELEPGAIHVLDPRLPFDLRATESFDSLVVRVDRDLVERHAVAGSSDRLSISPTLDRKSPEGRAFASYAEFVWSEIRGPDSAFRHPLVATEVGHAMAALLAQACSRAGAPCDPVIGGVRLRRAEEFLLAHLTTQVSAADAAEFVGVSVRSLSRTFRARYGMGPMTFLRERRFEAARAALDAAAPELETVTDIALRHGFAHLGRFSVEYRRRFGERPSETLSR